MKKFSLSEQNFFVRAAFKSSCSFFATFDGDEVGL